MIKEGLDLSNHIHHPPRTLMVTSGGEIRCDTDLTVCGCGGVGCTNPWCVITSEGGRIDRTNTWGNPVSHKYRLAWLLTNRWQCCRLRWASLGPWLVPLTILCWCRYLLPPPPVCNMMEAYRSHICIHVIAFCGFLAKSRTPYSSNNTFTFSEKTRVSEMGSEMFCYSS